jgi:predicted DNA-binding transcriptional regulator AlpA
MTVWLRFRELKERNIVRSWTQLKNLINNYGFPPGRMTGGNRTWTDEEVTEWREQCPVEGPELRGAAKIRAAARKKAAKTDNDVTTTA